MINGLDLDDGLGPPSMGVVSGPFTKRTFRHQGFLRGGNKPLDSNLTARRHGQPSKLTMNDGVRSLMNKSRHLELGDPFPCVMDPGTGKRGDDRFLADGNHHGAFLSPVPMFPANLIAMLPMFDKDGASFGIMNGHAVGATIDESGIRIFLNDADAGTDITTAVVLMPLGCREFEKIDIVTLENVFQDGTGSHDFRSHRAEAPHGCCALFSQSLGGEIRRKPKSNGRAFWGIKQIGSNPVALRITFDLVEQ